MCAFICVFRSYIFDRAGLTMDQLAAKGFRIHSCKIIVFLIHTLKDSFKVDNIKNHVLARLLHDRSYKHQQKPDLRPHEWCK